MYYNRNMTKNIWQADMDKLSAALAPYVFSDEAGSWISPDAPMALTRPYSALVSAGYFNGWIA